MTEEEPKIGYWVRCLDGPAYTRGATRTRDEALNFADELYRTGWRDIVVECVTERL